MGPEVKPLSRGHRSVFFYALLTTFLVSLPFIFLYATGYRFHFGNSSLVSTGGLYVAAERTGAEIYIDNELVRETRVFRRAFYAQNLAPGTHRVHVQKEGHHTWVKDLPVYPHLVTEAQAFNLPLAPQIKVLSPWFINDGSVHLTATSSVMLQASTTNAYTVATTTVKTSELTVNQEYQRLLDLFEAEVATSTETIIDQALGRTVVVDEGVKESHGIRLFMEEGSLLAAYVGGRENMPYYFCAEDFEVLGTSTPPRLQDVSTTQTALVFKSEAETIPEVQKVTEESECDPVIEIDAIGQKVTDFDFFPGGADFVIVALQTGVFVVEVDDRAWQNVQPLIMGEDLKFLVENGNIYVYDGELIYQVLIES